MEKKDRKLYDSWKYKSRNFMEFNNPVFQTLLGLVIFYIGLKMFSGGMKSMSHLEQLEWFLGNPYWMFAGAIVCTLLWQSSSLTTTAVIGLVASGALHYHLRLRQYWEQMWVQLERYGLQECW